MIGIGQNEIARKDKKEILATAWSICKTHYVKLIGGKSEKDLVAWANERVGAGADPIKNLTDKKTFPALNSGLSLSELSRPEVLTRNLSLPEKPKKTKR